MTAESHPLDGIDIKRLDGMNARTMFRFSEGTWWISVRSNGPGTRVRTPAEVERLLEVLGDRRGMVEGLDLNGSEHEGPAFIQWSGLSHFKRLDFSDCNIRKDGLQKVLACGHIEQLEHLGLSGCDISKAGVTLLKQSDEMPALRSLDLSSGDYDRTKWNGNMLKHLVGTKKKPYGATMRGLEQLKLGGWDCQFDLAVLPESDLGRGLRMLDLEGQMSLGERVRKLLHDFARTGGKLEELRLKWVFRNWGAENWNKGFSGDTLVPLKTLRGLVLDGGSFNAKYVAKLADAWFWPQLERLSLVQCNLYPDALKPWASASAGLRELWLDDNENLGRDALHEFAGYPMAAKLERLGLKKTASAEDLEGLPESVNKAVEAAGGV